MPTLTIRAVASPTRKRLGEVAEAAFLARATQLGFSVLVPWGDSNRYDSAVDRNHGLLRVQIKSAARYAETRYRVRTTGYSGRVYTPAEIDFFAAYVVPESLWYIIPIEAIGQRKGIRFYPRTRRPSRAFFERYREAWCLLDCPREKRGRQDIPLQCRSRELEAQCQLCPRRK